ncbi:MAG: hypothetical protein V5A25_08200 [Halovenus sp.]
MTNKSNARQSKVARLIEEYELSGIGETLEQRWTATEDRSSLRDLADYFNRQLLQAALDSAGSDSLDGEIENLYRLLTDDDVTSGVREQARNRLERDGVDPAKLEDDFVTYQSVRTYLRNYRDASAPTTGGSPEDRIERKRLTIQRLSARLADVTKKSLRELASASIISLGEFDVIVTVRVHCTSCGTQQSVSSLLDNRGCECSE